MAPSQPEQIVVLPDSLKAFIASGSSRHVAVVDPIRRVVPANLPVGRHPRDVAMKTF